MFWFRFFFMFSQKLCRWISGSFHEIDVLMYNSVMILKVAVSPPLLAASQLLLLLSITLGGWNQCSFRSAWNWCGRRSGRAWTGTGRAGPCSAHTELWDQLGSPQLTVKPHSRIALVVYKPVKCTASALRKGGLLSAESRWKFIRLCFQNLFLSFPTALHVLYHKTWCSSLESW